jgi:AcrR family transcriptional regulator
MSQPGTARAALLEAIVHHFVAAGVSNFTLRSLAADLGTSHQLLMYHFGSRADLMRAVLAHIQAAVTQELDAYLINHPERQRPSRIWHHLSKPGASRLQVQYQCLGLALTNPEQYGDFATDILQAWKAIATRLLSGRDLTRKQRDAAATLMVATMRGLGLDLMATNDRHRINNAAALLDRLDDQLTGSAGSG